MLNLLAIKQYLMKVRITSLSHLSAYFNADATLVKQMLTHWVQKGCVKQCTKTPACGKTCGKCEIATVELYEWVV